MIHIVLGVKSSSGEQNSKTTLHLNELRAILNYHSYGFPCNKYFGLKQRYIGVLDGIFYCTQNGLGNDSAFTPNGIICAGPFGQGAIHTDTRNAE